MCADMCEDTSATSKHAAGMVMFTGEERFRLPHGMDETEMTMSNLEWIERSNGRVAHPR